MASLWLKKVLSDRGSPVSFSGLRIHASLISLKDTYFLRLIRSTSQMYLL